MRRRTNAGDVRELAEKWMRKADREGKRHSARAALVWADAAGADIAKHTKGMAVRDGELIVYVDSSAWANELSAMSEQLRSRVNSALGKQPVRSIRFTVSREATQEEAGMLPKGSPDEAGQEAAEGPRELSEPERRQVEYAAAGIKDEALREAAVRAMTRSLQGKRGNRSPDGRQEPPE